MSPTTRTAANAAPIPTKGITITAAVAEVLAASTIQDNRLLLPPDLERSLYVAANKILGELGGRWDRYAKAHLFAVDVDLQARLAEALGERYVTRELDGHFDTPADLAAELIAAAAIHHHHSVLEPSAGQGALADPLTEYVARGQLYLVESMDANHQVLLAKGYRPPQLIHGDFLTTTALPDQFDRIVMNPPFEEHRDVRHVLHAHDLLAPGGRLVAVMASGATLRADKPTREFQRILERSPGAYTQENAPDTFKASGASARTITVVLNKAL
jgi:protein-L-isoaspartate O-methyltransferase